MKGLYEIVANGQKAPTNRHNHLQLRLGGNGLQVLRNDIPRA